jgi:hypothetical protein
MGKASILLPPSIVEKNVLGLNLRLFLAALTDVMMGPLSRIPSAQKGTSEEEPSNREVRKTDDVQEWKQQDGNNGTSDPTLARYPFTLIFENDSTAVPAVGRPIKSAG